MTIICNMRLYCRLSPIPSALNIVATLGLCRMRLAQFAVGEQPGSLCGSTWGHACGLLRNLVFECDAQLEPAFG